MGGTGMWSGATHAFKLYQVSSDNRASETKHAITLDRLNNHGNTADRQTITLVNKQINKMDNTNSKDIHSDLIADTGTRKHRHKHNNTTVSNVHQQFIDF